MDCKTYLQNLARSCLTIKNKNKKGKGFSAVQKSLVHPQYCKNQTNKETNKDRWFVRGGKISNYVFEGKILEIRSLLSVL